MRSFTVSFVKKPAQKCKSSAGTGGRFISDRPAGAARKAFSRLCKSKNIHGRCTLVVGIRETTQGSNHKDYTYRLSRRLIRNENGNVSAPSFMVGNKKIQFKYTTVIEAVDQSTRGCVQCKGGVCKRIQGTKDRADESLGKGSSKTQSYGSRRRERQGMRNSVGNNVKLIK